ncbi:MAG: hypothetical protein P8183_23985 [Anaerolineae bacterium]
MTTFIYQVQDDTIDASVSEQPDDLSRVTIAIDVHNPQSKRVACKEIRFEIAVPAQAENYLWPFLPTNPAAITAVAVDTDHWEFSRSDYTFTAIPIARQGFAGLRAGESATFLLQNVEVVPATGPTPIKITETLADGSETKTEIILHKQSPDLRIDRFDARKR